MCTRPVDACAAWGCVKASRTGDQESTWSQVVIEFGFDGIEHDRDLLELVDAYGAEPATNAAGSAATASRNSGD